MSENNFPEQTTEVISDVEEQGVEHKIMPSDVKEIAATLADKSLSELSDLFETLKQSADAMSRSKEAEAIKSAFYKLLIKLKGEADPGVSTEAGEMNPFEVVEENFKAIYADYKKARAEFNREQEAQRAENLTAKKKVLEDLKQMVESQEENVGSSFSALREIQNRWREIGPVPATDFRELNDNYQFFIEQFYDKIKINRDLRDLDFKKNLEVKQELCETAEKLSENENVIEAFYELQKLHEQWKEFGPVAKEFREDIWNRFKAATSAVNKRYQAHFEQIKEQQTENLAKKAVLCEKMEEIAKKSQDGNLSSNEWNSLTKDIEELQKQWRAIGFATPKENQKIYERFRAACDSFFNLKREYYNGYKEEMEANLRKKMELIESVEQLKSSKEWKKTTDQIIAIQKQWKEIGAIPRKKSEQLWKRFRAACDEFFAERDKEAKPENEFYANLKAKKAIIAEVDAYVPTSDEVADAKAMEEFAERFAAIGFVPFREKKNIADRFAEAMKAKFPEFKSAAVQRKSHGGSAPKTRSPKDILVQKYNALQQDITTYENNIGFFASSKNSAPLIQQMQERIEAAKKELKEIEAKIRKAEEGEE